MARALSKSEAKTLVELRSNVCSIDLELAGLRAEVLVLGDRTSPTTFARLIELAAAKSEFLKAVSSLTLGRFQS